MDLARPAPVPVPVVTVIRDPLVGTRVSCLP